MHSGSRDVVKISKWEDSLLHRNQDTPLEAHSVALSIFLNCGMGLAHAAYGADRDLYRGPINERTFQ